MSKGRSIFYKERDWDDFHFYNGSVLTDIRVIQPSVQYYNRGSRGTIYHREYYDRLIPAHERNEGIAFTHDIVYNIKLGTLRGLFFDDISYKLVTCISGMVYFVVLDNRKYSTNYTKWESFILSPQTQTQILVPPTFTFGYYAMEDNSIIHKKLAYKDGEDIQSHTKMVENNKKFNISWPVSHPITESNGIV